MQSTHRSIYDRRAKDGKEELSVEENEAAVSNKINERFKSLNVRSFKASSLTNTAQVANRSNKRRQLGGVRHL